MSEAVKDAGAMLFMAFVAGASLSLVFGIPLIAFLTLMSWIAP
jgi:hypothetical protein